ncbi:MAG: cytochrome c oxidase subunit 3 [Opitutaceae bacterium]
MSHAAAGAIDHHHDPSTSTGIPNKKLFMWAFLASDCMFFGSLISTHLIYRLSPIEGNPGPTEIFDIELTSFSTFILLMSSLMMALAVSAIQKSNIVSARRCLLTTMLFGLIFLGCLVYEFSHFVHEQDLTLSSSMFGSTFYVLTGTHGCHVAVGVLWLALMYVRSFKPLSGNSMAWLGKNILHGAVLVLTMILLVHLTLGFVHAVAEEGFGGEAIAHFASSHVVALVMIAAAFVGLKFLGKARGPAEFDDANAIDVESMGLYWHFVDIVWIVIFTVVYLIEYVPLI